MTAPETFEIPCRDGLSIRGDAYLADAPLGTVIACHGFKGFARWGFFPHLARSLAENGLTAVTFDFSGSGIGPDRESFTEPDAFARNTLSREQQDLENVVDYARRRGWINGMFGLFGHSRGGGTAIIYTAEDHSGVCALVTWASIAYPNRWTPEDVIEWRKRGYTEVTNSRTGDIMRLGTELLDDVELLGHTDLNIEEAAANIKVPWLIVHGTGDETVGSEEAKRLHERSSAVSTLHPIKGANHGFDAKHPLGKVPPVLDKAVRETVKFFVRNVKPG